MYSNVKLKREYYMKIQAVKNCYRVNEWYPAFKIN